MPIKHPAKRIKLTRSFKTPDQWICGYFLLALECDSPILEALYLRFRSFDEIFEELDPRKLWHKIWGNNYKPSPEEEVIEARDQWDLRLRELLKRKLIFKFGQNSPFSDPQYWFGCVDICHPLRVIYPTQHYSFGREIIITCCSTTCKNHGFIEQTILYGPMLTFFQTEAKRITASIKKEPDGTQELQFGFARFRTCTLDSKFPMRYKWHDKTYTLDFNTACCLLMCPLSEN